MTVDVSEFLDIRKGDVPEPEVPASGLYRVMLTRYSLDRKNNENRTPFVRATFKAVEAVDVDEAVDLGNLRTLNHEFFRTPKSDKIAVEFLTRKITMDEEMVDRWNGGEGTLAELWEAAIGGEVLADVKRGESKNGRPFAEITRFLKIKED